MTSELALPSLPAIPLDAPSRWTQYFETAEMLPTVSAEVLRLLETEDDSNPLTGYNLLEDMDFWNTYVALIEKGATRTAAARSLGIPPVQVAKLFRELGEPLPTDNYPRIAAIRRREHIAEIVQQVITAEGQLEMRYTNVLHEHAVVRGNPDIAKYLLERRFKEQWAPNKSVVHRGGGGPAQQGTSAGATVIHNNQVTIANISGLSDEQLERMDATSRFTAPPKKVAVPGKVIDVSE